MVHNTSREISRIEPSLLSSALLMEVAHSVQHLLQNSHGDHWKPLARIDKALDTFLWFIESLLARISNRTSVYFYLLHLCWTFPFFFLSENTWVPSSDLILNVEEFERQRSCGVPWLDQEQWEERTITYVASPWKRLAFKSKAKKRQAIIVQPVRLTFKILVWHFLSCAGQTQVYPKSIWETNGDK